MESQNKEKEYEHNVWEIYRKEFATASPEKKTELNKRMRHWQELMNSGLPAQQAYYKAMEEELAFTVAEEPSDKSPRYSRWLWMPKVPSVILALALIAAIVYSVVITMDRNTLNAELESVQSVLASTQSDLSSTKQTLTSTQSELSSTQSELGSTEVELSSTKQTLTETQSELSSTKQTLTSTQSNLSSTKQTLASTQGELEAAEAKLALYKETLGIDVFSGEQPKKYEKAGWPREIHLDNKTNATNPTWQQLINFLLSDPTDDRLYWELTFICGNFAEMLHNNAEAAGIKSAFVAVFFEGEEVGHALNAFKTTDRGLVYVDCQGRNIGSFTFGDVEYDKIAYVVKGKEFGLVSIDVAVSPKYSYFEQTGKWLSDWMPMGIVERIEIYW